MIRLEMARPNPVLPFVRVIELVSPCIAIVHDLLLCAERCLDSLPVHGNVGERYAEDRSETCEAVHI